MSSSKLASLDDTLNKQNLFDLKHLINQIDEKYIETNKILLNILINKIYGII